MKVDDGTTFPLLPDELWSSHIIPELESRPDAVFCLRRTCWRFKQIVPPLSMAIKSKGVIPLTKEAFSSFGVLQELNNNEYYWSSKTMAFAASLGRLDIARQLRAHGCEWGDSTTYLAAQGGHLEFLKWARGISPPNEPCPWNKWCCSVAAKGGHFATLKWMKANGCHWDRNTFTEAVGNGDLEMLEWLMANECPWDETTFAKAASKGNLQVMEWLSGNGCPQDGNAICSAAFSGCLEALEWMQEKSEQDGHAFVLTDTACYVSTLNGHLAVLKWLRQNGCPWDEGTCMGAARGGHFELLLA